MNKDKWWDTFRKTGHIADYLRYRGVDIYSTAENAVTKGGAPRGTLRAEQNSAPDHHRRSDHPGI